MAPFYGGIVAMLPTKTNLEEESRRPRHGVTDRNQSRNTMGKAL
jgi:hypothetical protein